MFNIKLSTQLQDLKISRQALMKIRVTLSTALCMSLAACSTVSEDKAANWSPNKIYAEAKAEANDGAYDKAIPLYEKLEGRAAGTPLAQQAQLDKAYAQFKNGDQAQAIATIERFIKLHPASPALDYALYLKGTVNFADSLGFMGSFTRQDLSERDQKAAKESFDAYKELAAKYPDSKYTSDARQRMTYIVNSLALYEVHVARYYFSRGAYVAAINRAQLAIADYRDVPALEEAMYIIFKSYDALGIPDLRDDAKRVMEKSFPKSEYLLTGVKPGAKSWWQLW
ncbi:MAG: outer membrane protein assembly factor BamD [Cellvibrio sp.]|uniref:outer membrane protein assembly factor BamD n=1 Tax=Cellvibrio sp. TaxID=1965322 RepID=UPI0027283876|nr:outer membrane protein assembly factor BamD [Cellvibrio sp.]